MKFVCVVNPVSGKGKGRKVADKIANRLQDDGHCVKVVETSKEQDDFCHYCEQIDDETRVVVIGGDGTLLYFLNTCANYHSLAFCGIGTANVIAHEFKMPRKLDAFVDMLEKGNIVEIRPGQTEQGELFMMMCSYGIDAFVLTKVTQANKNRRGKRAFVWPVIRALRAYTYQAYEVRHQDQWLSCSFALISRIRHYGGPFLAAPQADAQLDHFQVVVFHGKGFWRTCGFFFRLTLGRHLRDPKVQTFLATDVEIRTPDTPFSQLDGDYVIEPPKQLSVSEKRVRLIVP